MATVPRGMRPVTRSVRDPGSREIESTGIAPGSVRFTRPTMRSGVSGGSSESVTPDGVAVASRVAAFPFASTAFNAAP